MCISDILNCAETRLWDPCPTNKLLHVTRLSMKCTLGLCSSGILHSV